MASSQVWRPDLRQATCRWCSPASGLSSCRHSVSFVSVQSQLQANLVLVYASLVVYLHDHITDYLITAYISVTGATEIVYEAAQRGEDDSSRVRHYGLHALLMSFTHPQSCQCT